MEEPDVAVIIPTYNRVAALPAAVESVLAQEHRNCELIIVDDGSTDATNAYLSGLADERVQWHRFGRRRGANAARNKGAKLARAKLVSFLDSDDTYHTHRLADDLQVLGRHKDVAAHLSSFVSRKRSTTIMSNADAVLRPLEFETYLASFCIYVGGTGICIRHSVFDDIGGFDESLDRGQDRDILLRLARRHGCATTSRPNWTKNFTPDSISAPVHGRITVLNELCQRHPIIEQRYQVMYRYLVAQEIVLPIIRFRFGRAARAWREAKADPRSDLTILDLPQRYLAGRRKRRQLREALSAIGSSGDNKPGWRTGRDASGKQVGV